MTSESGPYTVRGSWTLLLGPGEALGACLPFLEAFSKSSPASAPTGLEQLENWHALFCDLPEVGRILVDADSFELQNLGLVRAFLVRAPGWELALMGSDGSQRATRELLRLPRVRWIPRPLDLEAANFLMEQPGGAQSPKKSPQPGFETAAPAPTADATEPTTPAQGADTEDDFLQEVERILRGEPLAARPAPTAEVLKQEASVALAPSPELEFEPELAPEGASPVGQPGGESDAQTEPEDEPELRTPPPPAPYFKHQVADLADLVQCVDLGLDQAAEDVADLQGPGADRLAAQFEQLSGEVARLRQFTHTLSFLASPPAGGQQVLDLAPLLEEMLSMRRAEPEAPRYLLRAPESLPVRTDKILLTQAFDALLFLCQVCAEAGGTVRVDGRVLHATSDDEIDAVQISIRFPAGRFADLQPAQILEPYALRRSLPELGANSLAAATGILNGQGGTVELHKEPSGGLEWLILLPKE